MTKATFSTDNAPLSPAPCRPSEGTRFPSRAPGSQPRLPPAVPAAETANERFCQDVTHRPPQPEQPEDKPQTRRRGPEAPEGPSPAARAGLRGPRAAGVPAHPRSPLLRVLGPLLPRPRGATDHQLLGPTEPRLGPRPGGGGSPSCTCFTFTERFPAVLYKALLSRGASSALAEAAPRSEPLYKIPHGNHSCRRVVIAPFAHLPAGRRGGREGLSGHPRAPRLTAQRGQARSSLHRSCPGGEPQGPGQPRRNGAGAERGAAGRGRGGAAAGGAHRGCSARPGPAPAASASALSRSPSPSRSRSRPRPRPRSPVPGPRSGPGSPPGSAMPAWGRVLRAAGRLRSVAASPGAARGASRGPGERPGGRGAALPAGPDLRHFLRAAAVPPPAGEPRPEPERGAAAGPGTVYLETYGCQMNVNDTEIAWAILQKNGYTRTKDVDEADVILLVTCSVREKAEQAIWNRLRHLKALKARWHQDRPPLRIGILGCMAERLKEEILHREKLVDIVAGPDAYRDLPRLLAVAESGQQAANVLLSLDETYADILPVQTSAGGTTAFVSIMRGCDNMCSYCIVPFTRGRERSRPIASILQEVKMLSDQGVKEVTLLGQNVNSFRDMSEVQFQTAAAPVLSRGFSTVYKAKPGGLRFAHLLDQVSRIDPEMRIRFTSPHPKDFPDEVLQLIQERHNVCKQLHLPAQSGSTRVLEAMRRGYTREAYLELVHHVRDSIPGVSLSSDFIAGFCGETEEDHQQTVSLLREVRYNVGFLFAYSMRQKTRAYHRLQDDVPADVKQRRLEELIAAFREEAARANEAMVGQSQLVLVEGPSKRSASELCGRNDGNIKVIFPDAEIKDAAGCKALVRAQPGDYVLVKVTSASSQTLKGVPLCRTTLACSTA